MGLENIHERRIVHRDLKPSNLFLKGRNLDIKVYLKQILTILVILLLGDFGIARMMSGQKISHSNIGTLCYSAPEVVLNEQYDCSSDIWSLGCVIYELCTLQMAFNSNTEKNLIDKITKQRIPTISESAGYSQELREILSNCFERENRMTSKEMLGCDIVQGWAREANMLNAQIYQAAQFYKQAQREKFQSTPMQLPIQQGRNYTTELLHVRNIESIETIGSAQGEPGSTMQSKRLSNGHYQQHVYRSTSDQMYIKEGQKEVNQTQTITIGSFKFGDSPYQV